MRELYRLLTAPAGYAERPTSAMPAPGAWGAQAAHVTGAGIGCKDLFGM